MKRIFSLACGAALSGALLHANGAKRRTLVKLSHDFISYEIDGEQIMVCLDSHRFSGIVKLNKTAAFIVEQLKNDCGKEELVNAVLAHFSGVDSVRAETDLDSVISALRTVGAIEE